MTKTTLISLGFAASVSLASQAAVIADWDFSTIDYTGEVHNSDATGTLMVSTLSNVAANATSTNLTGLGSLQHSSVSGSNPATGELNLNSWGSIEFTLTADAGHTVDLTSIVISAYRNGSAAPDNFRFQVSLDGGSFNTYDASQAVPITSYATYTFTESLSSAEGGSATIRFAPTGSTGNIHINGLTVNGDISAVPEPSSTVLLGLGGVALILRRRR